MYALKVSCFPCLLLLMKFMIEIDKHVLKKKKSKGKQMRNDDFYLHTRCYKCVCKNYERVHIYMCMRTNN